MLRPMPRLSKQDRQYCDAADFIFKTLHRCSWTIAKDENSCNSLNLISLFLLLHL